MTPIDEKIHPHLTGSLDETRQRLIAEQARAALCFEIEDERVEEYKYDEKERLQVHRTVSRRVFRGEACERYSALIEGLRQKAGSGIDLKSAVHKQLETDLRSSASSESIKNDVGGSLRGYADVLPPERWPVLLCVARDQNQSAGLSSRLAGLGFPVLDSGLLAKFGIVKFACPPEHGFVRHIADLPEAGFIADALTPVAAPEPVPVRNALAESRSLLGVAGDMMEEYGQDVTLAVLDTGIDLSHPAFTRVSTEDYVNFIDTDHGDTQGHGTHVASIAAGDDPDCGGRYRGIASRAHLVVGKVISGKQTGSLESILRGMAWAVFEKRADILSLSLGDTGTPPNGRSIWTRACDEAFRQGTLVCVAAGNLFPSCPESVDVPGDSATAVTVGAIDDSRRLAAFSAQGSASPGSALFGKPNCVAPGVDIVAARSSRADFAASEVVDRLHVRLSGTSMATPAVAGCLALLKSKARSLGWDISPAELKDVFYAACRPVEDACGAGACDSMEAGRGLADMKWAFHEVQLRAANQTGKAKAAVRENLYRPGQSSASQAEIPAAALSGIEPDVCYRCGKRYLGKVGTFSPAWVCSACGTPICAVCWSLGHRECARDQYRAAPADRRGVVAAPAGNVAGAGMGFGSFVSSEAIRQETLPMMTEDPPSRNPAVTASPLWGDTFLNRFDWKVRDSGYVRRPDTGEEIKLERNVKAQAFRRAFGEVIQFALPSGRMKKPRLHLAAISLQATGPALSGQHSWPPENTLRQISGSEGLDFQDERFYCVGVFSPGGWPAEWKNQAELRGNALFYLVEKGEGTCWRVFGPRDTLRDLFDPETADEKTARARKALADSAKLTVPGDQTAMDSFLEEHWLDLVALENAIQAWPGRFQIIEHRGKHFIQRSVS
jgi:hypothetical protein